MADLAHLNCDAVMSIHNSWSKTVPQLVYYSAEHDGTRLLITPIPAAPIKGTSRMRITIRADEGGQLVVPFDTIVPVVEKDGRWKWICPHCAHRTEDLFVCLMPEWTDAACRECTRGQHPEMDIDDAVFEYYAEHPGPHPWELPGPGLLPL